VDAIADSNKAAVLMVAAQFCDRDRLQQLGENIKTLCTMKLPKRNDRTILHVAAEYGNMAVAKGVIDFLECIDDTRGNADDEKDGEAVDKKQKARHTKSLGADLMDKEGATPLHLAALLTKVADVAITKISGIGVMHLAARAGAHGIVKI
jgi:ankyrin repeat protein